jgi:CLIP-associating protein 1/2
MQKVPNPDIFVNIFKNCLRSSNLHLTTAAIVALPPLLPLIITPSTNGVFLNSDNYVAVGVIIPSSGVVDASILRLVLTTLLPPVMERLGDKDRVQVKARESIALLGGYSFKFALPAVFAPRTRDGKGPETPSMIFERLLKDMGLASKVWKIREQVRVP